MQHHTAHKLLVYFFTAREIGRSPTTNEAPVYPYVMIILINLSGMLSLASKMGQIVKIIPCEISNPTFQFPQQNSQFTHSHWGNLPPSQCYLENPVQAIKFFSYKN